MYSCPTEWRSCFCEACYGWRQQAAVDYRRRSGRHERRYRRATPSADKEIVVLERGPNVSFVLCGLPYFISGVVPDLQNLIVYTPEYFRAERNIDVRTAQDVKRIDIERQAVEFVDLRTRQKDELFYDKLVIAAGAQPIVPGIRGLGLQGVFALRSLENAAAIKDFVARKPVRRAAVIGAGYIGLEMAESLVGAGVHVTMIEASASVLPGSEPEIASLIEAELQRQGVELLKQHLALSIEPSSGASVGRVTTDSGDIEADMVLIAVGARPDATIARETGINIGDIGGIVTDEGMRTNVPDIFAAGDCVEARHLLTGRPIFLPLGTTANKQGRRCRRERLRWPCRLLGHPRQPRLPPVRHRSRSHRPLP